MEFRLSSEEWKMVGETSSFSDISHLESYGWAATLLLSVRSQGEIRPVVIQQRIESMRC
jgi:hypothetical protein